MNSTKGRVLNVCIHASDLSLLPVPADLVWLIEFPETWSSLPLWSPGKIPKKYIQPVTSVSAFPPPAKTLDPNGIRPLSVFEAAAHTPSLWVVDLHL